MGAQAHIPQHFTDMAQGMSNSTGIDWEHIVKLSLFPELIRMSCSMVGAWGPATANHGLLQLRALDWSTDGPFQQFPVVLVMHPAAGNGHSFASMSWAGLMGSITGMSSAGIGVSEKVWLHRPSGECAPSVCRRGLSPPCAVVFNRSSVVFERVCLADRLGAAVWRA